ncbi:hypothetical protein [Streptosporangium canum]
MDGENDLGVSLSEQALIPLGGDVTPSGQEDAGYALAAARHR